MQTELTLCRTYNEVCLKSLLDAGASHATAYHWDAGSKMLTFIDTDPPKRIHYVVIDSDLPRHVSGMTYSKVNGDPPPLDFGLHKALNETCL